MNESKKVLFIVPYPVGKAPSQRFRVEQFLPLLDEAGVRYSLAPFMDIHTWNILYTGGSALQKAWGIIKGYLKRWKHVLVDVPRYDVIFIHREAAPLGPPLFEWLITKLWRKKTVYDFDDAIWIPNTSAENKLAASLKCFWKVRKICGWVTTVTGGNQYLCDFAMQSGAKEAVLLPTVVDTDKRYNCAKEHHESSRPVIGWTGSHSTLKYIDEVLPVLKTLEQEHDFCFLVIADKDPGLPLKGFQFIPWQAATEIDDLLKIDIGIMPLSHDKWSEGKCGFKLIQYMALGIPAIASPVGVNGIIIDSGVNGYCAAIDQWKDILDKMLAEVALRWSLGQRGREKIVAEYSVASQRERFIALF